MDATTPSTADPVIKIEPDDSETEGTTAPATPPSNASIITDNAAVLMDSLPGQTVQVLNMGHSDSQKLDQMRWQGRNILIFCKYSRIRITSERAEEMRKRFADARLYLDWLDTDLEMTPAINNEAKVELVLTTLMNPVNHVLDEVAQKAEDLLSKYKAENWGRDLVADENPDGGSDVQPTASAEPNIGVVQIPSPNDPVFGTAGIMYGIMVDTSGKRKDYRLRPDLPRKSYKVYGHNDIALGTWFPFQISALFYGAHGARMAGIAGSVTTGAWSIVIARTYEGLDTDNGNTLYYSGSNSHDNKNPRQAAPASQGTRALHASLKTQNPVRVLRSGGSFSDRNKNPYLPSCGLRYDGLYRVVEFRKHRNQHDGLYDQFKLERLPDQTLLSDLQRSSPTTEQVFARDRLQRQN